jgi:hypothetical protein
MSIATQCPQCGQRFSAPDQALGQSVRCSQCGNAFIVQSLPGAAPPAARNSLSRSGPAAASSKPAATRPVPAKEPAKRSLWLGLVMAALFLGGLGTAVFFAWRFFSGGPTLDWKEFVSAEGGFTVLMPTNPVQTDQDDPKIVTVGKIHEVGTKPAGARTFTVHYYDLADRPINDYLYFGWLKNRLLEKGGKFRRENEISPSAYPCKEIVVDLADDQILVRRIYLAEARVFLLTAEFPKTPAPTPDAQKFFESFKITSVPRVERPAPTVVALAEPKGIPPAPAPTQKQAPEPPPASKAEPQPAPPPEKETPKKAPDPPVIAKGDHPAPEKAAEEMPATKKPVETPPLVKADPPSPQPPAKEMPSKEPESPAMAQAKADEKLSSIKHARSLKEIRNTLNEILAPDNKEADEKTQAFRRLKAYRYLAEAPYKDLVLDENYNKMCLAGAMLCEKIGKVDHKPRNPGIPAKEFQFASQGTSKSSMREGPGSLSDSVDNWMNDSDPENIKIVGHRRSCLRPAMQKTGFGHSGIFSAMYVFDASRIKIPEYEYLCYPANGLMPNEFFGDRYAWSVMLNPKKYKAPGKDFMPKVYHADAQGKKKGESLFLDFKTVDTVPGYGTDCIIFRPEKLDLTPGAIYVVELNGIVQQGSGKRVDLSYLVEFMNWKDGKDPPAVATVTPAPENGKFVISPEDRALIDEINRFRKSEKASVVEPVQDLFEAARHDAKNLSQNKGLEKKELRYSNIFHYSFPVVGSLSAREMVASMTNTKALRAQVADEDLHYVGIGSSTGADGRTYYMFLFCGAKR